MTRTLDPDRGWLPRGRPLLARDLGAAPDDGHRYELIDGVLVVTPSPTPRHQGVAFELAMALNAACPPALKVFMAPLDVPIAADSQLQPDVLVVPRTGITESGLTMMPALAVEVLSPSTRRVDLLLKRERYERAGCVSYWVVDPGDGVRITAWELVDGRYAQVVEAEGDQRFAVRLPFEVTIVPRDLLR